jgi:protein disulfide-isomerase
MDFLAKNIPAAVAALSTMLFLAPPADAGTKAGSAGAGAGEKAASVWTQDIEEAFSAAKKSKKPVFVDFTGSDWCYWCILADKNIFGTKQWADFAPKMVCLKVDFPKNGRPDAETMAKRFSLAREFNVRGYPTFVLVSPERKEIARFSAGRKSAGEFIAEVEKALKP